jgi:hypothetical protein
MRILNATSEYISQLEQRVAKLEKLSNVRDKGESVLKAMNEFEKALLEQPSFSMKEEKYYADLNKKFYDLKKHVEKEIKHIKGAY